MDQNIPIDLLNDFAITNLNIFSSSTPPFYIIDNRNIAIEIINTMQIYNFMDVYNKYHLLFNNINACSYILFPYLYGNTNAKFTEEERALIIKNISNFSHNTFDDDVLKFVDRFTNLFSNYIKIGERINYIEQFISKLTPLDYTIEDKKQSIAFDITKNGNNLNEEDILDMFSNVFSSDVIPFIIYTNNNGKKYFKIYNETKDIKDPKMFSRVYPNNSIIFLVRNQIIVISMETNDCVINIDQNKTEEKLFQWIDKYFNLESLFPEYTFTNVKKESKLIGNITFDYTIDYNNFYELIIIDKFLSLFFYIEENVEPWASKTLNYSINYRNYNSSMIIQTDYIKNYMQEYTIAPTSGNDVSIRIPVSMADKNEGITFSFTAVNKKELDSFIYKFSRLLPYAFNEHISELKSPPKSTPKTSTKTKTGTMFNVYTKGSDELTKRAPEIFEHERKQILNASEVANGRYYKTTCASEKQPVLLDPDEVEDWENNYVVSDNKIYKRTVLEYPPQHIAQTDKKYYFTCPTDKFPNIYFIENQQDEKSIFEFFPCCETSLSRNIYETDEYRFFNRKIVKQLKPAVTTSKNTEVSTDVLLFRGGSKAKLDDKLNLFLSQAFGEDIKFNKLGAVASKDVVELDSFIKAVIFATSNNKYDDGLYNENNMLSIRNMLAGNDEKINLEVYKQELYDWSDEKIKSKLLSDELIDSYYFYRGLEELFNVNIFIFGKINEQEISYPISYEHESITDIPTMEIARCKYMSIRNKKYRPTILLYRSFGTTRKQTQVPNYEVICLEKANFSMTIFELPRFIDKLFDNYHKSCNPIEWDKNICYNNPFDTDWSTIFPNIRGQELDGYGKTITLILDEYAIGIPPTQPFNLPVLERPPLKSFCDAANKFNAFNNNITTDDGFWIPYNGNPEGIKIYCEMSKTNFSIMKNVNSIIENKNKASLLMQLINYLWRHEKIDFETFWNKYSTIGDSRIFEHIPNPRISCNNRKIPEGISFEDRVRKLIDWWPFFFYNCEIHVSDDLSKRILNYFKKEEIMTKGLDITPPKIISDLIFTDNDFKIHDDIIFDNEHDIFKWLDITITKRSMLNMNIIHKTIDNRFQNMTEPFFFQDERGKIYLIQNITSRYQNPFELPALQVAKYWKDNNSNPGHGYFNNDTEQYLTLKYVIYILDNNKKLILHIDKTNMSDDYFQIILYGGEKYAAMLPLL